MTDIDKIAPGPWVHTPNSEYIYDNKDRPIASYCLGSGIVNGRKILSQIAADHNSITLAIDAMETALSYFVSDYGIPDDREANRLIPVQRIRLALAALRPPAEGEENRT